MKRVLPVVLLAALLFTGCAGEEKAQRTVFAMDTVMDLLVWGENPEELAEELPALLTALEAAWSAMEEDSVIGRLNRGVDVALTEEKAGLLERVEALSRRTGGAFDPHLLSLSAAWGFPTGEYRIPGEDEIAAALADRKWDLGAAVKGYAGQRAVALLEERGAERAILNLGGNVQTYGEKADGSPWQIAIRDPEGEGYLGLLSVTGTAAVVTSGDYQRYFEMDGVRYHHILDPETGCPARSGLRSVTVICRDGLTADALSTALFVMGLEDGIEFWRQSGDFEAVFVCGDGTVWATAGAALTGCEFEVIERAE